MCVGSREKVGIEASNSFLDKKRRGVDLKRHHSEHKNLRFLMSVKSRRNLVDSRTVGRGNRPTVIFS